MTALQDPAQRADGDAPGNASSNGVDSSKRSRAKTSQEGSKIVIRRLPPGMTQDEFLKILGDKFKPKNGKVGWFNYVPGEVSSDASEPSRPARAYLQILRPEDMDLLEEAARSADWHDAKETWQDAALIGPPSIELPLYKKMPTGNKRVDPRQGTIDTDPEYMAFLEAQTQPIVKKQPETDANADDDAKAGEKVTPLVAFLREKHANKAKDSVSAKAAKHARQGSKGKAVAVEDGRKKKMKEIAKADKTAELPKDFKILTKKATADAVEAAKVAASQVAEAAAKKETTPKSRRAGIAAIAKTLQRDLGLSPGNAHRKARQQAAAMAKEDSGKAAGADKNGEASTTQPSAATMPAPTTTSTPTPTAPKALVQASLRGRGKKAAPAPESVKAKTAVEKTEAPPVAPKILLKKRPEPVAAVAAPAPTQLPASATTAPVPPTGPKAAQSKSSAAGNNNKRNGVAAPTSGATRAFVKHANLSQGVTEALLKQALSVFGDITLCEIDRRKGFAYVDFADHDGLIKAIAASPVSVAQAAVQVLERKDRESKKAVPAKGAAVAAPTAANNAKEDAAPKVAVAPPTAPAADKATGEHKRGTRRRGGRNRAGAENSSSKDSKDSGNSKGSDNAPAATSATAG